jgi:hypothetical protein
MAARSLAAGMDDVCLAFSVCFVFISFMCFRLANDWQTRILISSFCLFFVFAVFVLDAWLSFVKDEEWKARHLSHEPTEHSKEEAW